MATAFALTPEVLKGAELVAGACLVLGMLLIGIGAVIGVRLSVNGLATDASKHIEDASKKVDDAQQRIQETRQQLENLQGGLEGVNADDAGEAAHASAVVAEGSASAAKSALEQVSGIVGALPENLRFAGLLVLVGTLLVSVATTQFGGVSLF